MDWQLSRYPPQKFIKEDGTAWLAIDVRHPIYVNSKHQGDAMSLDKQHLWDDCEFKYRESQGKVRRGGVNMTYVSLYISHWRLRDGH